MLAVVLVGALAVASWQAGWLGQGSGAARRHVAPKPVAEVPSTLPPGGVKIAYAGLVLRPWTSAPTGAMSAKRAIAVARHFTDGHRYPAAALETELTQLGTELTVHGVTAPRRHDVWLVTFTYPKPVDVGVAEPSYATRYSVAVDAATGKFVVGFFT